MDVKIKNYYSFKSHNTITDELLLTRNKQRMDYCNRLCKTTHDYIMRGGNVIMLLFTYNDENLPHYQLPSGEKVVCFSRQNIRDFLNRLKVNTYRYNRCDYKYFLAMEYGGNSTRRPHIHALFFLSSECDVRKFIDTCRKQWSYGFIFPSNNGNYVEESKLRSYEKGASYASKYVCKDLSYYKLPSVMRLLEYRDTLTDDDEIRSVNDCLPRIYQSNGIGASFVDEIKNLSDCYKNGLLNPLTKKTISVPTYVLNKYLYKNVKCFDGRKGKKGNLLYDRTLKVDPKELVDYKLLQLSKCVDRFSDVFDGKYDYVENYPRGLVNKSLKKLYGLLGVDDNYILAYMTGIYRNYARYYSSNMMEYIDDFFDLFDVKNVVNCIVNQADTYGRYLLGNNLIPTNIKYVFTDSFHQDVLKELSRLCDLLDMFFVKNNVNKVTKLENDFKLKQKLMRLKYDKNLC